LSAYGPVRPEGSEPRRRRRSRIPGGELARPDRLPPPRPRDLAPPRARARSAGFEPDWGRRRPAASRSAGSLALLVFGFVVAGVLGAGAYYAPVMAQSLQSTGHRDALTTTGQAPAPPPPGAPFTVLLLGSDDDAKFDPKHLLTQSMILVRVDPTTKQATMLSIPRDLWVPISPTGVKAKIDTAYSYGGARAAIATVESNLHVHVDDYVWIGLKGLVQLIDRVGGVDVVTSNPVLDDYYPADLDTTNPYGFVRVAVLPGAQHLSGAEAMKYVRSRHSDLRGDLGRSARQQQVLLALKAKAQGFNLADLPDLSASFAGELSTSVSLDRFRSLLPLAALFQSGDIHQVVLGPPYTQGQIVEGQDALIPDWSQILPLVHQTFPAA
jgi:LCP family protein required for cell wall assembly